jgi:hypothetical protein
MIFLFLFCANYYLLSYFGGGRKFGKEKIKRENIRKIFKRTHIPTHDYLTFSLFPSHHYPPTHRCIIAMERIEQERIEHLRKELQVGQDVFRTREQIIMDLDQACALESDERHPRMEELLAQATEACAKVDKLPDFLPHAACLNAKAHVLKELGCIEQSLDSFQRANLLFTMTEDKMGGQLPHPYSRIFAETIWEVGKMSTVNLDESERLYKKALERCAESDRMTTDIRCHVLHSMTQLYLQKEDWINAEHRGKELWTFYKSRYGWIDHDQFRLKCMALVNKALTAQGRIGEASEYEDWDVPLVEIRRVDLGRGRGGWGYTIYCLLQRACVRCVSACVPACVRAVPV